VKCDTTTAITTTIDDHLTYCVALVASSSTATAITSFAKYIVGVRVWWWGR